MPNYLLSPSAARKVAALCNRADLTPVPRPDMAGGGAVASAPCPQWRPRLVPGDGDGAPRFEIGPGWVWVFDSALSGDDPPDIETTAERHWIEGANLGDATESGRAVWRWTPDGPPAGEIAFQPSGATPPDGACDVVLAELEVPVDGAPAVHSVHIDTIFFTVPTVPPEEPGGGGDDENPEEAPNCGNPLNDPPSDRHPLDEQPGGGGGGADDDTDDHPLDHEGPGGFTPNCNG